MQARIVSDGTSNGTKVVDENGDMLQGITCLAWNLTGPENLATVDIRLIKVPCEVTGEAKVTPVCTFDCDKPCKGPEPTIQASAHSVADALRYLTNPGVAPRKGDTPHPMRWPYGGCLAISAEDMAKRSPNVGLVFADMVQCGGVPVQDAFMKGYNEFCEALKGTVKKEDAKDRKLKTTMLTKDWGDGRICDCGALNEDGHVTTCMFHPANSPVEGRSNCALCGKAMELSTRAREVGAGEHTSIECKHCHAVCSLFIETRRIVTPAQVAQMGEWKSLVAQREDLRKEVKKLNQEKRDLRWKMQHVEHTFKQYDIKPDQANWEFLWMLSQELKNATLKPPTFAQEMQDFAAKNDAKIHLAIDGLTSALSIAGRGGKDVAWQTFGDRMAHMIEALRKPILPDPKLRAKLPTKEDITLKIDMDTHVIKEMFDKTCAAAMEVAKELDALKTKFAEVRGAVYAYGSQPNPDSWVTVCQLLHAPDNDHPTKPDNTKTNA